MTTFWSGFQSSASDADLKSPDTDVLLSMWNSSHAGVSSASTSTSFVNPTVALQASPSNPSLLSDPAPPTIQPILNSKPRKRLRDANNPRTKVACTACYLSKSCCDQARPCGRCVRLNRPEQCQDRIHKKRTVNTGSRTSFSKSASSGSAAGFAPTAKSMIKVPKARPVSTLQEPRPSSVSAEIMSGLFSSILADLWLHQCQLMLTDAMAKGDQAFALTIRRIEKVTRDLSGLVNGPVYMSVRQRLYDLGVHVGSNSIGPIKRPPFHIITAEQAQEQNLDHDNIAIIKSVQLPDLLAGPNPRRGLYINDRAQRLFGYTAEEFCELFNRTSADHAFIPFWIWIISQRDWVNVIRHNSLFFLSEDEPISRPRSSPTSSSGSSILRPAAANNDDSTLVVTCIDKQGRARKCLVSTRSCIVSPRSYSFCFIALGGD